MLGLAHAAGIQLSGFALHRHFNHNDLYHVVQMIAFYFLYRGGRLLRDYVDPRASDAQQAGEV